MTTTGNTPRWRDWLVRGGEAGIDLGRDVAGELSYVLDLAQQRLRGEVPAAQLRHLPLLLDLPLIQQGKRRSARQGPLTAPEEEDWLALASHPIELLRQIEQYLKRLNTERLPTRKRIRWREQVQRHACPALRKIYSEQHKAQALPESHDRREGLVVAIHVCRQLAIAYKRQLSLDYALPETRFLRVRGRLRRCGLRALELIRMEQRLRAMRYQKLLPLTWRDCNAIYFALAQTEDVNAVAPAMGCLQLRAEWMPGDLAHRAAPTTSVQQTYLAIQLFGLMDANTVSSRELHVVDAQINPVLANMSLEPDDGGPLADGRLVVYCQQDCPPYYQRQDEKALANWRRPQPGPAPVTGENELAPREGPPALQLDIVPLAQRVLAAHADSLSQFHVYCASEAEAGKGSRQRGKAVADKQDLARMLVLGSMCDQLRRRRRSRVRDNIVGRQVLYVYNGYASVFKLLTDNQEEDEDTLAELAVDNELRDTLAGRSALITSGRVSADEGQWFVLDRNDGGVHIKTRESQFTTAMFIGQLVAFAYSREQLQHPLLGYVVRLCRDREQEIEITVRIISQQPQAAAVQSDFLSQNDMALPAILLSDSSNGFSHGEEPSLLLHHSHRMASGLTVKIETGGESRVVQIGDLMQIQREFVVYRLAAISGREA
ncbi:MAG: hypothetical protein GXP17_11515 [Gammaproteobacteria bacterium]|nr:hypothetical protein [Gammaproteobacteria bacterium]